jgi:3-isopropylmalate/(R)-2-methylmalate dehydratase large subunit
MGGTTFAECTFAEKALARAAGQSSAQAGEILSVRPDRVLTHDNTAAIAQIFYDQLGCQRVADPEQLCIILDHASPPPTPRHAQNHAGVRRFVREQGVRHFFEVGRGICHQVLSEEALVLPGQVILGADSHTTHFGWLGAFGAGVGRSEAAVLWSTRRIWLRVPESIRFTLTGALPAGVTTKDLCLYLIGRLGADGGLYTSVEFGGPGLEGLSLESRMVIPNMMAEFGVKNAYLEPDRAVFSYLFERLAAKDPAADLAALERQAIYPDPGARYSARCTLALDRLEPMIACPHTVDHVQPLSAVAGRAVDLAFIGTCTNGRLEDLAAAAAVLRGRKINAGTRLIVIPASSQVYTQALKSGILENLVEAGAAVGIPGCGPCMGNHQGIPAAGETVISTANRNFRGRMGQPEAEIFLASPAVVAASAVLGRIAGPAELRDSPERIFYLGEPHSNGAQNGAPNGALSMEQVTSPHKTSDQNISTRKGPGDPGSLTEGRVWKYGDNVNTDSIFPGKHTYTLSASEEIAAHALEDLDPGFASGVKRGDAVFGGRNWGCGSSREQAASCLKLNGVAAVVAASFGRIFYRNAINQGLPAIVCPEAAAAAESGDPVRIDLEGGWIHLPGGSFAFQPFPPHIQAILEAGGLIQAAKKGKA